MSIDERLEALATNVELLQGMVRDVTGKVDALSDKVDALTDAMGRHEQEFQRMRVRMLRAAAGLMGMGEAGDVET